jgi:hypothetical protein
LGLRWDFETTSGEMAVIRWVEEFGILVYAYPYIATLGTSHPFYNRKKI